MPKDSRGYQEIVVGPQAQNYRKVLLKDGVPVGMLSLGERKDAVLFKRAIDHGVNLMPVASHLFADDFKLATWLDKQRVPTPVLAVSKVCNAAAAKPVHPPIARQGAKRQFIRKISFEEEHDEQARPGNAGAGVNPYALPVISVAKPETATHTVSPTEAYLVPVFPTEGTGGEQNAKEEYVVPEWAETKLSQTGILIIGREPNASLVINHSVVSRRHAEITFAKGYYVLRDLGSKNGTFLNGIRLEPHSAHILIPGDQIRIGTVLVFMFQVRSVKRREEVASF